MHITIDINNKPLQQPCYQFYSLAQFLKFRQRLDRYFIMIIKLPLGSSRLYKFSRSSPTPILDLFWNELDKLYVVKNLRVMICWPPSNYPRDASG
jgi:hypothetical protein